MGGDGILPAAIIGGIERHRKLRPLEEDKGYDRY